MKLSILIPVRNEGVNIKTTLKILRGVLEVSHEILIVYDTPEDDTVPVVQSLNYPHVRLVHNTRGKGVANAIKTGIEAAKGGYISVVLADDIGSVIAIEPMLDIMDSGCDMVSGTRYAKGGRRFGGSPIGAILSTTGNKLFQILSGSTLSDCTTGCKMFRKSVFKNILFHSSQTGWVWGFYLAIIAQVSGLRVAEVPIVAIDRPYGGKSTFKLYSWFKAYLECFFWGIRKLRSRNCNKDW